MADRVTYVTADGLTKLEAELRELKTVSRRELAQRIEAAKALGDLSENAEYHDAKESLAFVEGRIREIEDMMKNISVIEAGASGGVVRVGSTVDVEVNGKKKTYKIVGSNEANPAAGLISNESPLGSAFLGHAAGAQVSVETPGGNTVYRIVSIV
jgi:transcription elongation factor GreA